MTIKNKELIRLTELYKQGLNFDITIEIVSRHKQTYDKYLNNDEFKNCQVGHILTNLFFSHYETYKKERL